MSQQAAMSREDILAVYEAGSEEVIKLANTLMATISHQSKQIAEFKEQNTELKERVKALEDRLNKNSRNRCDISMLFAMLITCLSANRQARKNSFSVIDALQSAFEGNPFIPIRASPVK